MRIAVVGATGMIGRHVAREALRAGHGVIAVCRHPQLLELINDVDCEPRQANLEDVNSLIRSFGGGDAVIHCAAYYPGVPKPLAEEMQTTTRLSENFYGACARLPLKKIVYVGAAIALPKSPDGQESNGSKSYLKPPTDKTHICRSSGPRMRWRSGLPKRECQWSSVSLR